MKFELTETVAVANPEEVLRVLEQHLRAVAGDVVRSEGQVTAFGIGPSPRTVNRRDTTVIDARAVDGQTVLSVQVNYQASALLGNMPQDGIVRSKIEGAIDEMRGELKVWKPWGPPPGLDAAVPVDMPPLLENAEVELPGTLQEERKFDTGSERWPTPRPEAPQTQNAHVPEVVVDPILISPLEQSSETDSLPPTEVTTDIPVAFVETEREAIPTVPETLDKKAEAEKPAAEHGVAPEITGKSELVAAPEIAPMAVPMETSTQRSGIRLAKGRRKKPRLHVDAVRPTSDLQIKEPFAAEKVTKTEDVSATLKDRPLVARETPLAGLLRGQGSDRVAKAEAEAETQRGGRWKTVVGVVIVVFLALVVGAYFLRDVLPIPEPWKSTVASWTSEVSAGVSAGAASLRTKIAGAKPPEPATPAPEVPAEKIVTVTDPEVMVKAESNIYLWVQDWASALRSKDPVAQASYYADTVSQYLTNSQVTRDFVQEQKKAAIAAREDLWTMRVEHVYVESQNSAGARLRVVRRVMARNAAGVTSEHAVKVRLKLVRVGDTWKILEEQETGPAV